jgi:putative flippase GtrA
MTKGALADRPIGTRDAVRLGKGRVREWARFGLVGLSGLVVNQLVFLLITELVGIWYLLSAVFATLVSSSWNFLLADRWAFANRQVGGRTSHRYLAFLGLNFALLPARLPVLWFLTDVVGLHYGWSNIVSLLAMFAIRLVIADQWLWRPEPFPDVEADSTTAVSGVPRHRYDIAGLLTIHSDVELRELRNFAVGAVASPDLRITVGLVSPRPTRHVLLEDAGEDIVYREHLGALSANFSLHMGEPIEVRVSPLLAKSPHVVYTNIVEAFLRFLLVSKGYVLLHSAAIANEDGVTLLSAQTDTGKTSTVITLVRSKGYRFLSDDMTIIDPSGYAISYPKPMTLSFHTMAVAKDGHLTRRDRAALAIQSRLHSKSGRTVGRTLGDRNLPIMTLNSIVQAIVPPPKHRIERLFPCAVGGRDPIRNVVLLSKGEDRLDPCPLGRTVKTLLDNTDDAYTFPPFASFAPHIRIGGEDYASLRRKERELLAIAVSRAAKWQLSVHGYGWSDVIPSIMDATAAMHPRVDEAQPMPLPAPMGRAPRRRMRQPSPLQPVGIPVMASSGSATSAAAYEADRIPVAMFTDDQPTLSD